MEIESLETELDRAESPRELWQLFTGYFRQTVVQRVLYHHLPPIGAEDAAGVSVVAEGFPEELIARYVGERMYRRNPLLAYAQQSVEPFYFDEIDRLRTLSEMQREWVTEVRAAGLANGLGVPVFGPGGRNGYFGLGFRPGVARLDPGDAPQIQSACQRAHLRYCGQILTGLAAPPNLSDRETQVLVWVARGKSNAEIAAILGISAHTVDAHLRRIYLKLGVYDRITAAIRGIGIGIIHSDL